MNIEDNHTPEYHSIIVVVDERGKEVAPDNKPYTLEVVPGPAYEGKAHIMQIETMIENLPEYQEDELRRLKTTAEEGVKTRHTRHAEEVLAQMKLEQEVAEK